MISRVLHVSGIALAGVVLMFAELDVGPHHFPIGPLALLLILLDVIFHPEESRQSAWHEYVAGEGPDRLSALDWDIALARKHHRPVRHLLEARAQLLREVD